ncbi:MAG: bifunctional phosphoribosylaminoimidazolecarboxamide formyltransferase/IMP cyclohydrolase PurH [Planctomycetota bacterium]|nr:MAG: bifunctional phosphoribosylaminoimidazolecarboxamide formyltransferase/IMP cyclohydrolase PurH [Planctomycetota bacterium]
MPDRLPVRRALLSVFHKEGVVELARALAETGAELLSTGGTMRVLVEAGLKVTEVADYTGFPEMMDGRVKTLHPKIHGGLLARRDDPAHLAAMAEHGIEPIDLVCVNLYPFEETVAAGGSRAEVIEKIDIGGPSMLRSAAKNHDAVAVVCDPADYEVVAEEIRAGGTTLELRRALARKVFERTAEYDGAIARWFADQAGAGLRYGENPHQAAGFYPDPARTGLGGARVLPGGKELSYNNWLDLDGAVGAVNDLPAPAAVVVKHTNPCGAAVAAAAAEALARAWDGDPLSAFGSVIALNVPVDRACAEFLAGPGHFVEVLAAPAIAPEAAEILRNGPKWGRNVRLVEVPDIGSPRRQLEARRLWGATLWQESDATTAWDEELKVAGAVPLPPEREADLRLAQTLAKHLKSNAVCLVRDGMLVGAGAGQMSRVDSCRIAVEKAGERARGAVAGSDAFFPFPDGPETLAAAGVVAIAQPGGSVKDAEVTAACDARGVCMVHTGARHFRH